jgi:predicted small metal-binding protein
VKTSACGDVVPGCSASFTAVDDGGILDQVGAHAAADHGLTDIGPELVAAVRAHIRAA